MGCSAWNPWHHFYVRRLEAMQVLPASEDIFEKVIFSIVESIDGGIRLNDGILNNNDRLEQQASELLEHEVPDDDCGTEIEDSVYA